MSLALGLSYTNLVFVAIYTWLVHIAFFFYFCSFFLFSFFFLLAVFFLCNSQSRKSHATFSKLSVSVGCQVKKKTHNKHLSNYIA